jgi:hypothetical protein
MACREGDKAYTGPDLHAMTSKEQAGRIKSTRDDNLPSSWVGNDRCAIAFRREALGKLVEGSVPAGLSHLSHAVLLF